MTDCQHTRHELRKQTFANGRCHLRAQCLDCGKLLGDYERQDGRNLDDYAPVDYQIQADYQAQQRDQKSRTAADREQRRHAEYEDYLRRSPRWQRMRQAVLDRDGHVCRGCLAAPATEVHHAAGYGHIFREFGWELVGVCRSCHERAHGLAGHIRDVLPHVMADITARRAE